MPSRSAMIFFSLLVHQTIEEIHRIVLDGKLSKLNETRIRDRARRGSPDPAASPDRRSPPNGELASCPSR